MQFKVAESDNTHIYFIFGHKKMHLGIKHTRPAPDKVCFMKVCGSELQGRAKAKLFCPRQSEINPAEIKMRQIERMKSSDVGNKRQRARERKGWSCQRSKSVFQPVETAYSANGPESNNLYVFLSCTGPPRIMLINGITDRIKPFQRAQNNKSNLSVRGTVLTRTPFQSLGPYLLSCQTPRLRPLQNETRGNWINGLFPLLCCREN